MAKKTLSLTLLSGDDAPLAAPAGRKGRSMSERTVVLIQEFVNAVKRGGILAKVGDSCRVPVAPPDGETEDIKHARVFATSLNTARKVLALQHGIFLNVAPITFADPKKVGTRYGVNVLRITSIDAMTPKTLREKIMEATQQA